MKLISELCGICLLIYMICFPREICGQNYIFRQLTTNQGISQNHIGSILMDKKGFMWLGSEDGLNMYDGYTFVHYKHAATDTNSIDDSYVQDILEDHQGSLWVATSGA